MWVEIATGGAVVGLVGLIIRSQNGRIGRVETKINGKVGQDMCDNHYTELKEDLKKGSERFDELIKAQAKTNTFLARLDERFKLMDRA